MSFENTIIVQAIYSFKGQNNDELCFKKGDKITLTQKIDGGWWEGTLNGKTGWFPSNYVKELKNVQSPISPTSQKRQYYSIVLHDLTESEKSFVSELQGLIFNFLHPLEKSSILNSDEFHQLTGNINDILDVHKTLLKLLEENENKSLTEQKVGNIFLTWAPKLKYIHQTYCSLHPKAACILDKFKDDLGTFMESCGANQPGIILLTTGLSKPFRRLDKYSSILQELERHIDENHHDRGDTQRSIAVYNDISSVCATTRRQKELELQVLTGPVRGWEGPSLAQLGDIIHMGSVAFGPQHHDRYLVLFSNNLLILSVSQRMSAFIYEGKLPLTGIKVKRIEDNDLYKNAFEITCPLIEPIIAICQTKSDAQFWVEIIQSNATNDTLSSSVPVSLTTSDLQNCQKQQEISKKETLDRKNSEKGFGTFYGLRPNRSFVPNSDNMMNKINQRTLSDDDDLAILRVIEAYCNTNKLRKNLHSVDFENVVLGSRKKHDIHILRTMNSLRKSGSEKIMTQIPFSTLPRASTWCCGSLMLKQLYKEHLK